MVDARDEFVDLLTVDSELSAGQIRGILSGSGIETTQRFFNGAGLGIFGHALINPVTIQVRPADLERAREALERNREESVDIDWDEVDVGAPEDPIAASIAARDRVSRGEYQRSASRRVLALLAVPAVIFAALLLAFPSVPNVIVAVVALAIVFGIARAVVGRRMK